ncbi:uncharacterized protein A1O5_08290 [Cladophialophora psammophila CBS 110553]|uniref:Clr5 domain-containing protein n=1 Tax=Cladophialophora psammophila CBS 110553 TaxID=1182543 RepID=W9WK24_9EURO|nr:uncharacterized protein A1O5_08290 [Cladophialophora psammophila CBS 110553]EXJ68497.1 hypothetical protein A1O5_08290 [Cladophialophora psammophila CBS 110553]
MATSAPDHIVDPMEVDMDIGIDNTNPGAEKARTISKAEWEKHKQDIYQLYMIEKKPMADLVNAMVGKGFKASGLTFCATQGEAQYFRMLREWGFHKKMKRQRPSEAQRRRADIGPGNQVQIPQDPRTAFTIQSQGFLPLDSGTLVPRTTLHGTDSIGYGSGNNSQTYFRSTGQNQGSCQFDVGYGYPNPPLPALSTDPFINPDDPGNLSDDFLNFGSNNNFNELSLLTTEPLNNVNTGEASRGLSNARDVQDNNTNSGGGSSRSSGAAGMKGKQPIHFAVQTGNLNGVKFLLDKNPKCAHLCGEDGISPLWIAAQQGHTRIVKLLIDGYQADVNTASTDSKRTPLHQASQNGHTEIVRILLDKGALPDLRDSEGVSPLWTAAQKGSVETVNLLVSRPNVEIDAMPTDIKRTALHQAAQGGHTEIVRVLLEHGANVDPKDLRGITPLWSAAQRGSEEIVTMLLQKNASADTMSTSGENRRPLHQAAQNGHTTVCKLLLKYGASYEPLDDTMCSPLFFASQGGHSEIVRMLLEKGASPENTWEGKDGKGRRCLHQAAQNGHLETVRLLLDHGAHAEPENDSSDSSSGDDSDDTTEDESQPKYSFKSYKQAMKAAKRRGTESTKSTKPTKAPSKSSNKLSDLRPPSPLGLALQNGHYDVAKLLIERGADVNSVAHLTLVRPLHFAVFSGKEELVKLLIDNKADINGREVDGWPPLMFAAQIGNCKMIDSFIDEGVDVNATANSGVTALWIASQQGHTAVVQTLLKAEARSFAAKSGRYPVHQAAQNAHFEVVKLLVEEDPNCVNLKDARGTSLISLASSGRETVRVDIMKYLDSKGAPIIEEE